MSENINIPPPINCTDIMLDKQEYQVLDSNSLCEINEDGKYIYQNGLKCLVEPSEAWILKHQTKSETQIKEERKQVILKELEKSDLQLIRLVEDLTEFAETLGFKANASKKALIQQRKALRQELSTL